jgi:hypothetical protein
MGTLVVIYKFLVEKLKMAHFFIVILFLTNHTICIVKSINLVLNIGVENS